MDRAKVQREVERIMRHKSLYELEELLAAAYAAGFSDCAAELAAMHPHDAARVLKVTRKELEDE